MTRYGTLIAWAKQIGRKNCVSLLQQTLDEEKETDKKLTALAESGLNTFECPICEHSKTTIIKSK